MKAPNIAQRLGAILISVSAFMIPWLVFVSDRATAWVIGPVALIVVLATFNGRRTPVNIPGTPFILAMGGLAGITLLAFGSPLWGPDVLQADMHKQAERMLPAMIAGIALILGATMMPADRSSALSALKVGCLLAVGIAVADTVSGRWLLRLRHAVGEGGFSGDLMSRAAAYDLAEFLARFNDFWVVATLSLALLITLTGRKWLVLAGLAALAGASLLTISETSLVMALAGFMAAAIAIVLGRFGVHATMTAVIAAILSTPWLFPVLDRLAAGFIGGGSTITHKIRERLEIWAALSRTIPDNLLLGHGIAFQRTSLVYPGPKEYFFLDKLWHPHSIFVQIWQDLGLAGAALLCVAVAGTFQGIANSPERFRPGLLALAVMILGALGAAHSIWLGWWLCAFFIIAALAINLVRQAEAR